MQSLQDGQSSLGVELGLKGVMSMSTGGKGDKHDRLVNGIHGSQTASLTSIASQLLLLWNCLMSFP